MDYYQIMKWLELVAYICGFLAAGLVTLEVISWITDWFNNWKERREARKRNHAHPYNFNKLRDRLSDVYREEWWEE